MDRGDKMGQVNDYENKFLFALLSDNIVKIAEVVSEELKCPFNIVDETYHILAQVPKKPINDVIWDTLLDLEELPLNILKMLNDMKLIENGYKANIPFIISKDSINGYVRAVSNITINEEVIGYTTTYFIDKIISEEDLKKLN